MKLRHITILLTSLLVFPAMANAGEWVSGGVSNSAGSRTYMLWVPSVSQAAKPKSKEPSGTGLPLVMMLHGCLQKPQDLAVISGMNSVADQHNFLVVYPEQSKDANALSCWNWFDPKHQERGAGEPWLLAAIVQQVGLSHRVDARRVYVAGISAGAAMAVVMGATYPDLFSGVGVMAGLAYKAGTSVEGGMAAMKQGGPDPKQLALLAFKSMVPNKSVKRLPVIVFHGTADPYLNPVNAEQVIAQWIETNDYLDDGKNNGSVKSEPARTFTESIPGSHSYTRDVYGDHSNRLLLEKWIVKDLGHAWSGSPAAGPFADPKGPNAAAEMWRFFNEVSLDLRSVKPRPSKPGISGVMLPSQGGPRRRQAAALQGGTR